MGTLILIGLLTPFLGFLINMFGSWSLSRKATGWIACSAVFISFICFASILWESFWHGPISETIILYPWLHLDSANVDISLHIDSLSLLMTLVVTGVGFLIHVYANGYMDHETDYARFFALLNFFIFSMLLLVLAGDLVVLFIGWEGVGLASYFLIGFWYSRPAAARAATKAFVINRIGDLGFLLGILLCFHLFGTTSIGEIISKASSGFSKGDVAITVLTLLLFCGAVGKSAQLPLHTWLPDAMEGPTPVSALIHAATMVTAGVYLVVRLHVIFLLAPTTLCVISFIGAITALMASLSGLGQTDLKRVLAYSTVSQLGLMFVACGVRAFYAAMFHLTTHAFIKALLFLSAGNVVHMMHGQTMMAKMGGLSKKFTYTNWFFLIGVLALAGIPPFAAFFSKDLILEEDFLYGSSWVLFGIALVAAILTGVYLTRAYVLAFQGKSHVDPKEEATIKEAPKVMLTPVAILAILSIFGGLLGVSFGPNSLLGGFLAQSDVSMPHEHSEFLSGVQLEGWFMIIASILGVIFTGWIYYTSADKLKGPLKVLKKAFYLDELYWFCIAKPLASLSYFFASVCESSLFTGSIHGLTRLTQGAAGQLQLIQSGQIRSYVAWMVAGFAVILIYFVS